jgi:hypothetical protein
MGPLSLARQAQVTRHYLSFRHQRKMLVRGRITPVAVIAGLVIMILALVYAAFNRAHSVSPRPTPLHDSPR